MSKKSPAPAETKNDGAAIASLGLTLPFPQKTSIQKYTDRLKGLEIDGGIIRGAGTATSDDIPAKMRETGEPIMVSNGERIVSADQDELLNAIAQGAGYKSLDSLFADFGLPVGPKIKGGRRAAADGLAPELDPFANRQPTAAAAGADDRTKAAIAAPPTLGGTPARSEPVGNLTGPAAGIVGDPFGKKPSELGNDMQRDATQRNDMQRSGGIYGGIDMAGANAIMARENKARGEMIDLSIKANGGNGIGILGDGGIEAANAEKTQRWATEDLMKRGRSGMALAGQLAQVDATKRGQDMNYASTISQQGITMRGQDLNAQNDQARNQISLRGQDIQVRGQDIGAQGQQENNRLSAVRAGIDMGRFNLESQAAQRQQSASDALAQATASGDQAKIAQARQAVAAAGLKVNPLQHVETDKGIMVFDQATGRMTPAVGPDGAPVGGGKALTEFQGKSTSYGMRANDASQIIDQVGQGGKVQPSLIKRAAEAVPLIGEGLSMVANKFQTAEQQQVEQAQRDFVNAVLRQESGAAISQSEFDNARKQYFSQSNDTPEVIAQKQANREAAINGFRISAGPGAKNIGGAPAQAQPAQPQQQPTGAPKVGTVDGKHVYLGGPPHDPASWAEVR